MTYQTQLVIKLCRVQRLCAEFEIAANTVWILYKIMQLVHPIKIEPMLKKTNNQTDQVGQKPGCTLTEEG